jgi:4-amino-4-deoxy-L-arabinose transferase-like glycosyltransferase
MTAFFPKNYKRIDIYAYVLFIVSAIYMFYNLWCGSLYAWDEGWYGEVAREIVIEGRGWLTLHYNYQPWFHKPPLYIWMIAIAYKFFGVNEFAVRIWSTIFGFSSIILVYFLSKKLFLSERVAFFSSLILVGFAQFVKQSRMGMMDAPLTFFILLGIYFFWIGRKREWYLLYVGIITGIAFMLKSFAAFQIPIIIILFSFITGERKRLVNPKVIYGFLIGFLICLPWHLYQYIGYGITFINEYFLVHIVKRTFESLPGDQGNVLYYFKILNFKNIPLGTIGLFTIPYIFVSAFLEKDKDRKAAFILMLTSIAVILLLFSVVTTKLPWYIVPVYPFLSISIAVSIDILVSRMNYNKGKLLIIIFVILIAIPIARFVFDKKHKNSDYSSELKKISLSAKNYSGKSDPFLLYRIHEETVTLFYSERKISRVNKDDLLMTISNINPFICLMSKKDGFFKELKNKKYGLTILKETDKYILYKR